MKAAEKRAVTEARLLATAGFDGLIIENFGDIPFHKSHVPPITIAALTALAGAVVASVRVPVGVNVLRNDAHAALAIAAATGATFIRVNVLSGVMATDQGLIEGDAAGLLRERARITADIAILADVHVKHARPLASSDIELAIEETALRAGASGVIITGATTGRAVDPFDFEKAALAANACGVPLYVGSGATAENISSLMKRAHGVIVSSALRVGGRAGAAIDPARIRRFLKA